MTLLSQEPATAPAEYQWYFVRLTHPNLNGRIVFRSLSETRARQFIERKYPRGSEAHLVHPDGTIESHEAERQGDLGMDLNPWQPFDPSTWVAPEQQVPPGENAWSDKEG